MIVCWPGGLVRAMMTADGLVWGSRSRNSYLFGERQKGTLCCSPERMPPQRHPEVDVGQPGGSG